MPEDEIHQPWQPWYRVVFETNGGEREQMVQIDGIKHAECPVSIISRTPEVESIAKNFLSIRSVKDYAPNAFPGGLDIEKVASASV